MARKQMYERPVSSPKGAFKRWAAVGLLAGAGVHGYIEANTNHGHGPRVATDIAYGDRSTVASTSETATFPPVLIEQPVAAGDTVTETFVAPSSDGSDGEYARNFDDDPAAKEIDMSHVPDIVERVEVLRLLYPDNEIVVGITGLVSADDDGKKAGLTEESEVSDGNVRLGLLRAETYRDALDKAGLSDVDNLAIKINYKEGHLTKDQASTLDGVAEKFGYNDVEEMVEQWNTRPQDSPPLVGDLLRGWLGNRDYVNRGVEVSVSINSPNKSDIVKDDTKQVCAQFTAGLNRTFDEQPELGVTIPYGVLLAGAGSTLGLIAAARLDRKVSKRRGERRRRGLIPYQGEVPDREIRRMIKRGIITIDEAHGLLLPNEGSPGDDNEDFLGLDSRLMPPEKGARNRARRARELVAPFVLPLAVVGSASLILSQCSDSFPPKRPPVAAADPCNGMKPVQMPHPEIDNVERTFLNGKLVDEEVDRK